MKKLISVLMILTMMLCLVPAVSADSPAAPEYAKTKEKDFYEYINELYDLIERLQSKQKEPVYVCFYDVNDDGLPELFVDKNNGKQGVDVAPSSIAAKREGYRFYVTKGSCDMYYWDYNRNFLTYCTINSPDMLISIWPDAYCAVGYDNIAGQIENYNYYSAINPDGSSESSYLMLSYTKGKNKGEAEFYSNGSTRKIEIWEGEDSAYMVLTCSQPLVFTNYYYY